MNNRSEILVWINCYGGWAPELRHPIETIGYDQYLEGVASAISSLQSRIDAIYVSGGMIDQKGRTECQTTIPELERRLTTRGVKDVDINADEDSVTSISIAKKFLEVWQRDYSEHAAVLFCDTARFGTNAYALEYFSKKNGFDIGPIHDVLIPIDRLDNHPDSTAEKQAEKLHIMKEKGVEEVERAGIVARQDKRL